MRVKHRPFCRRLISSIMRDITVGGEIKGKPTTLSGGVAYGQDWD